MLITYKQETEVRRAFIRRNSLKGHSVAPAHPDGLPKEQGVKRHYKSEHAYIKNFDSRIYRWTDGYTDRHIDRTKGTEGHIEGQKDT